MSTSTTATASASGTLTAPPSPLDVLTLPQAAAYLQLPEAEVRAEAEAGRIEGRQAGDGWRFLRESIIAWLKAPPSPGPWPPNVPCIEETPEEQEAFLEQLRVIRKSYGTVGGGAEDEAS